jgi:SAM-dependent methyltransferase
MNSRTYTGIAAAAIVWQLAGPAPSRAQEPPAAAFSEEYAKQGEIYQRPRPSRGYVVDRTLEGYCYMLPDEFDDALGRLGEEDRWLDVGAGQGQAILDYYASAYDKARPATRKRRGKKAKSVAVSIEDRRTPEWHKSAAALAAGKIQYRYGKPLREYAGGELGRFQLITDVMGGFTYASDLSRFMQTVMQLLEVDGSFFTLLQDVEVEEGTNKPWYEDYPYFSTEIESATGAKVPMCSWLKSITCAEVRCEARPDRRPQQEVYHVRKVCDQVSVPALVPVDFQAGTPPQRGYRLEGGRRKAEGGRMTPALNER